LAGTRPAGETECALNTKFVPIASIDFTLLADALLPTGATMSDSTPNLDLPYIAAAQAQKHVTHNEAIRMLDALVNLTALSTRADPPADPVDGDRYIVAADATGTWSGKSNAIAAWQDDAWSFFAPQIGWRCYDVSAAVIVVFGAEGWSPPNSPLPTWQNVPMAGVNVTADLTSRLAVSAPATLLSHEGDDHRVFVNKASPGDTASVLFQDGFSGRAECGLGGDDDFRLSVSPDGAVWHDSMIADRQTGEVSFPGGVKNPQLHGTLDNPSGFDRLYLDAVNGDDTNDGRSKNTAVKTMAGLSSRWVIGRRLEVRLLTDVVFDQVIAIGYVVPQLILYGRNSGDTAFENRKITVADATNVSGHPGSFLFQSFASVLAFKVDVELATTHPYAFFNFNNSIGFLRTHELQLTRTGTGTCCLFANGASFVPSSHYGLNVHTSAAGYVATGIPDGVNPNTDWRYPCNLTAF
jgi:hypothetical protein